MGIDLGDFIRYAPPVARWHHQLLRQACPPIIETESIHEHFPGTALPGRHVTLKRSGQSVNNGSGLPSRD